MKLVLATQNKNKVIEIKKLFEENNLNQMYEIYSLNDLEVYDEVEEDGKTLEENAYKKAKGYFDILKTKKINDFMVIADDTGLFVEALNGAPGIYAARYAGENVTYLDNRLKLLKELKGIENRNAYFATAVCMVSGDLVKYFHGKTTGRILKKNVGKNGFGYDAIFYSNELKKSFGVATTEEKGKISHRGKAINEFINFLKIK